MAKKYLGLSKNVFTLGLVSFFMDVSSEMIYPLMPLFLTNILGVNKSIIGLIEGIAESTASLLKVVSGYISDKLRRRKVLILSGYGLSTITRPILALATSWLWVLGYRFVDRIGKGIRTAPRDAIIAESTSAEHLGRAFGFHRAMDTFGAIVGPAIALIVIYLYSHQVLPTGLNIEDIKVIGNAFRAIFWFSIIPGLIAVFLIIFFVRERIMKSQSDNPSSIFQHSKASADFRKFLLIVGIFSLGNSSMAFIILKVQDVGATTFNVTFLYLLFNTVYSFSSMPAGIAADYFGKKKMILISYILFGVIYFGFAYSKTQTHVWTLLLLYGVFMGISEGIQRAFVATLLSNNYLGTGYGVYHTLIGLIALPSSLIAGLLWDMKGPHATFLFGTITAAIASILFLIFFWRPKKI